MKNTEYYEKMVDLLEEMIRQEGSDLFITTGFPAAIKKDGTMTPLTEEILTEEISKALVESLMNENQLEEFKKTNECQFAIAQDFGRFRVSAFVQQNSVGAVLRVINTEIPDFDKLGLPDILKDLVMKERGLIIFVGATGSGKSTTLAAMLGYRNKNAAGHIITIEDPIEFVHPHQKSIITQREVGVDTQSWENALQNTLRQAPNVILIGEVRSKETMEHAINFAETGHLVLCTLHANSANQALDRIINFFEDSKREQLLMDLSLNLAGIIAQRLVRRKEGGRTGAMEIMLNSPMVSDLIVKGEVGSIKEIMKKSKEQGMIIFDDFLFDLYESDVITYDEALRHADSKNEVRLNIKLNSKKSTDEQESSLSSLSMVKED